MPKEGQYQDRHKTPPCKQDTRRDPPVLNPLLQVCVPVVVEADFKLIQPQGPEFLHVGADAPIGDLEGRIAGAHRGRAHDVVGPIPLHRALRHDHLIEPQSVPGPVLAYLLGVDPHDLVSVLVKRIIELPLGIYESARRRTPTPGGQVALGR